MASPVEQFRIEPLIKLAPAGIDISFTNSSLMMAIAVIGATAFLSLAMRRKSLVPDRAQAAAELCYSLVANMIRENIGEHGRQYFPLVFTLFCIVLLGNMLGMLPYSFTYTSHLVVTGALALMIFLTVIVIGFARHGPRFVKVCVPPDVPKFLLPLVIAIEIISFLARPVTLSVRLFANMMAGHLILKVFAGFSVMMASMGLAGFVGGLLPMLFNVVFIAFEFLIAFLHAYVFAILSCIYLKDTIEIEH
jgi:F-type H+-transporting ATPase subunit a